MFYKSVTYGIFVVCFILIYNVNSLLFYDINANSAQDDTEWKGRWFPEKPKESSENVVDKMWKQHVNEMNSVDSSCDDGKTNITFDWPTSYSHFICMDDDYLVPKPDATAIVKISALPKSYMARHVCMQYRIHYDSTPPLFGPHRRIWAQWGEYRYLPQERWVHSLEHGGIVMLYHPCAEPFLVDELKRIVKSCLYRHIITPYKELPSFQPLAIIAWGKGYFMPTVDEESVRKFIKENALRGPEQLSKNGLYNYKLIEPAKIVTTVDDTELCPAHINN